jgi:hypothetical protein
MNANRTNSPNYPEGLGMRPLRRTVASSRLDPYFVPQNRAKLNAYWRAMNQFIVRHGMRSVYSPPRMRGKGGFYSPKTIRAAGRRQEMRNLMTRLSRSTRSLSARKRTVQSPKRKTRSASK